MNARTKATVVEHIRESARARGDVFRCFELRTMLWNLIYIAEMYGRTLAVVVLIGCASAFAEVTESNVLAAISRVEVGSRTNVTLHADGVSCGDYGVTMQAPQELVRVGWLVRMPTIEELCDPATNREIARLYLLLMYQRHGSWWEAVGWYHGGNKARRDAYAKRVWWWL